jgi:hypothetical protein
MQISLLEKANLAPAEIEYVALIFTIIEAHGTGRYLLFFVGTNADTRIKVPPLAILLRLRESTKFRTLSLLALPSLMLVTPELYQA